MYSLAYIHSHIGSPILQRILSVSAYLGTYETHVLKEAVVRSSALLYIFASLTFIPDDCSGRLRIALQGCHARVSVHAPAARRMHRRGAGACTETRATHPPTQAPVAES